MEAGRQQKERSFILILFLAIRPIILSGCADSIAFTLLTSTPTLTSDISTKYDDRYRVRVNPRSFDDSAKQWYSYVQVGIRSRTQHATRVYFPGNCYRTNYRTVSLHVQIYESRISNLYSKMKANANSRQARSMARR